ncbi:hypothetical protein WMF30_50655 [Sorangium sp. So ce134]
MDAAYQSVLLGMGLSLFAMGAAVLGSLPPPPASSQEAALQPAPALGTARRALRVLDPLRRTALAQPRPAR